MGRGAPVPEGPAAPGTMARTADPTWPHSAYEARAACKDSRTDGQGIAQLGLPERLD